MFTNKRSLFATLTLLLFGIILGLGISSSLNLHTKAFTQEPTLLQDSIDILSKTNRAMAELAAAVKPAVVNISSTRTVRSMGAQNPFFDDPFFRQFFGDNPGPFGRPREQKQASLGSGVIVDKDGYILTNNHVIKDADEIKVKLSDKREFKGKVVGSDPKTDLAVVKIASDHLPIVKLGDSDALKVGETVVAIGNPFGLSQTVTSGIVSAIGRANVGIADYEDFIQTDAAINPGNSGGALVNIKGELVGINTAIFSTSGGYQGVGFAVPSSMAKTVMESLKTGGKVVRGWLGIQIQPITPELAKQFGLKEERGALVGDVVEDSPAEKAGILRGDIVLEFGGREVADPSSLRNMAAATAPNKEVIIKLLRDGKEKTVRVTIAELPAELQNVHGKFDNALKGVMVQGLTPDLKKSLDLPNRVSGVVVTDIEADSPAAGVIAKNDVILEINRKKVSGTKDYESVVSQIKSDQNILLLVFRGGSTIYITLSVR